MKPIVAAVLPFLLVLVACAKKNDATTTPGPIDGSFTASTWTCGTTDLQAALHAIGVAGEALNIANADASLALTFTAAPACTQAQVNNLTYTATTFTTTQGATSCGGTCTVSSVTYCSPTAAPSPAVVGTWNFAVSGSTLTLTRTLVSADVYAGSFEQNGGCTVGQLETLTLTKI